MVRPLHVGTAKQNCAFQNDAAQARQVDKALNLDSPLTPRAIEWSTRETASDDVHTRFACFRSRLLWYPPRVLAVYFNPPNAHPLVLLSSGLDKFTLVGRKSESTERCAPSNLIT